MRATRITVLVVTLAVATALVAPGAAATGATADDEAVSIASQSVELRDLTLTIEDTHLNGTGLPEREIDRAHYTLQEATLSTDGFNVTRGNTTYTVGALVLTVDDVGLVLRDVTIADGTPETNDDKETSNATDGDSLSDATGDDTSEATGEGGDGTTDAAGAGTWTGPHLQVRATCAGDGGALTVTNVGDEAVEVRDLDVTGDSQNVVDGRPVLDPGESLMLSGVADGPVELQAFAPGTVGDAVGERYDRPVDCR